VSTWQTLGSGAKRRDIGRRADEQQGNLREERRAGTTLNLNVGIRCMRGGARS
jgi:hypothetical protein